MNNPSAESKINSDNAATMPSRKLPQMQRGSDGTTSVCATKLPGATAIEYTHTHSYSSVHTSQ